jgi:hypothetical protein
VWKRKIYWNQITGLSLFQVQSAAAWLKMGSGLYRRGQAMGEEESVWSLIICDHQMEQVDVPGYLSNWKFLSCFAS